MDYGFANNITIRTKILNSLRKVFLYRPLENGLVKLTMDKPYGTLASKFVPNHYQYPKGVVRNVKRDGVKYSLDLSDLVDWYIYFGFKDPSKGSLFNKINEGDVVLDIGANMGDLSFNFCQIVGEGGHVYSFEPDGSNFSRLKKNWELNEFNNVTLIQKGIGDNPGSFLMEANEHEPGNDGSKRIISKAGDKLTSEKSVEIIQLDQWLEDENPTKINLVKMDIEGYEFSALKSAAHTLEKHAPILYLELHDVKLKEHGSSAKDLCALIESYGYKIYDADSNSPLDLSKNLKDVHDDIVCYKSQNQ